VEYIFDRPPLLLPTRCLRDSCYVLPEPNRHVFCRRAQSLPFLRSFPVSFATPSSRGLFFGYLSTFWCKRPPPVIVSAFLFGSSRGSDLLRRICICSGMSRSARWRSRLFFSLFPTTGGFSINVQPSPAPFPSSLSLGRRSPLPSRKLVPGSEEALHAAPTRIHPGSFKLPFFFCDRGCFSCLLALFFSVTPTRVVLWMPFFCKTDCFPCDDEAF